MTPLDPSRCESLWASLLGNRRARRRNQAALPRQGAAVVYWMQRAQRAVDNPALDAAIESANLLGLPCVVHLGLVPFYPGANLRHLTFLLDGVGELAAAIEARGAAFVLRPYPDHRLAPFVEEVGAALVIGDENPLRAPEGWRRTLGETLKVPLVTVDADVIVPSALFPKEEFAARTLRPKIQRELGAYLRPSREPHAQYRLAGTARPRSAPIEADALLERWPVDRSVPPVATARGGTLAGAAALAAFVDDGLATYADRRNQPHVAEGTSRLSAYLHFGHLGPRQIALAATEAPLPPSAEPSRAAFLEELIVRRELAINFVARNPHYDSFAGLHPWARATLDQRRGDPRPHLYDAATLEAARTHDELWNAGQHELVSTGRMHGYVRMYWAKKILEWSATPEQAIATAIHLNDKYLLDGRDPNGYTGIAWAIGGKHDRPWAPARPIFGTIRYMSFASTSKKFDWKAYRARVLGEPQRTLFDR